MSNASWITCHIPWREWSKTIKEELTKPRTWKNCGWTSCQCYPQCYGTTVTGWGTTTGDSYVQGASQASKSSLNGFKILKIPPLQTEAKFRLNHSVFEICRGGEINLMLLHDGDSIHHEYEFQFPSLSINTSRDMSWILYCPKFLHLRITQQIWNHKCLFFFYFADSLLVCFHFGFFENVHFSLKASWFNLFSFPPFFFISVMGLVKASFDILSWFFSLFILLLH